MKPYAGYHIPHDKSTNKFCIRDLYVLYNISAVIHCKEHFIFDVLVYRFTAVVRAEIVKLFENFFGDKY